MCRCCSGVQSDHLLIGGLLSGITNKGILSQVPSLHSRLINIYRAGWEPEVSSVIGSLIQQGWRCVDVGAHEGYFTLLMAKLCGPEGRVIVFEAQPKTACQLRSNVTLNRLDSYVLIENLAVSDGSESTLTLFPRQITLEGTNRPDIASWVWSVVGPDEQASESEDSIEVASVALDDYFPPNTQIDFIKMDIEGGEVFALPGMKRILNESRPLLLVEFHGVSGWNSRLELLAANYQLLNIAKVGDFHWVGSEPDIAIVDHCLAVPLEKVAEVSMAVLGERIN